MGGGGGGSAPLSLSTGAVQLLLIAAAPFILITGAICGSRFCNDFHDAAQVLCSDTFRIWHVKKHQTFILLNGSNYTHCTNS